MSDPTTDDDGGLRPVPGTDDQLRLFQVSRQLDQLRDDCRWLLSKDLADSGAPVAADCAARLGRLRASLEGLVDGEHLAQLSADVGATPEGPLAVLAVAVAQLAAWVDGLLLAPAYLASEQARAFNAEMMQLAAGRARTGDEPPAQRQDAAYI